MAWFFRSSDIAALEAEIARLKADANDSSDTLLGVMQELGDAKAEVAAMTKAMTEDGAADIALRVAAEIADVYVKGAPSVEHRNRAVAHIVLCEILKAATGKKPWRADILTRKGD